MCKQCSMHVCVFVCLFVHLLEITSHQIRVDETLNKIWSKVHCMQANATTFIYTCYVCVRAVPQQFFLPFLCIFFPSLMPVDEDKLHCWYGQSFIYVSFIWLILKYDKHRQYLLLKLSGCVCCRTIPCGSFHAMQWWWFVGGESKFIRCSCE